MKVERGRERPARLATLEVRFAPVVLRSPKDHKGRLKFAPIATHAIIAREARPPKGETAIEWQILTTLPVTGIADAAECLRLYSLRWRIERLHYTLKSGAHIEDLQLEDIDRMWRALAVFCVVAWRLLFVAYQARVSPSASCEVAFTRREWTALTRRFEETVPSSPPDLQTAVRYVARLGGFLARRRDGDPGVKVLWRGLRDLAVMIRTYEDILGEVGNG